MGNGFHSIQLSSIFRKAALAVLVLAFVATSWFIVRRTLGVTVALSADSKEIADLGIRFAPDFGPARSAAGRMLEKTFLPDDLLRSQAEFEKAVELSPNDFRLWLELAGSYEKSGEAARAEAAFKRALELAPNYSRVQWAVGNFLLRQERSEEGFALIRTAAERESALAPSAAAVAWNVYDGDLSRIEPLFSESDFLKSGLAVHLSGQGRFADAMRIWSSLPFEKRSGELQTAGDAIYAKVAEARKFLSVLALDGLAGKEVKPPGSVNNGGFEEEIRLNDADRFAWQLGEGSDTQVGIDAQQVRNGARQRVLAMLFSSDGKSFRGISQTVPVEPGRTYALSVAYRSELSTKATMRWEIVDSVDSKVLAVTDSIADRSDWTELSAVFTVPDGSEGVVLRLVRTGCTTAACSLSGRVWFDDVVISNQ